MVILFTLLRMPADLNNGGMYSDLFMEFKKNGHDVTVMAGSQDETCLYEEQGVRLLKVKSMPGLYVKNLIKKGIGMATLPWYFKRAYKKYLKDEQFDWIVMPTPPITLIDVVIPMGDKNVSFLSENTKVIEDTGHCKCACPDSRCHDRRLVF